MTDIPLSVPKPPGGSAAPARRLCSLRPALRREREYGILISEISPQEVGSTMKKLFLPLALAMIPMLVLYLLFQKQFIEGIATSGGKL